MCNNPNLLPQVNRAKCATIALMVFGILSLFSFANLMNPWYWNEWALVFVIDGVGGILGIIASSTLICCGGAGINDQQAKASAACKHKGSMGCAIGAAVCFGAYVIAMVIALAQLAGCDEDVSRADVAACHRPDIGSHVPCKRYRGCRVRGEGVHGH